MEIHAPALRARKERRRNLALRQHFETAQALLKPLLGDPNNHNGAVFLGLNGVVVKSHGSANALGVANAVAVTVRLLEDNLTDRIAADLARLGSDQLRPNGSTSGTGPAGEVGQ